MATPKATLVTANAHFAARFSAGRFSCNKQAAMKITLAVNTVPQRCRIDSLQGIRLRYRVTIQLVQNLLLILM